MVRSNRLLIVVCCLAVLTPSDVAAQRRGLIVGFGMGPAITTGDVYPEFGLAVGLATDFKFGGMVGESVQLYFASKSSTFSDGGSVITSNLGGLGVTYQIPSGFALNGAVGLATWADFDWDWETGFGLGAGVGYEFADLWVVNVEGTWGRISDSNVFNVLLTFGVLSH